MLKTPDSPQLEQLVSTVLASSKYHAISPDLVRSIGIQELGKRRHFKEALKATKNKLHQVGAAYLDGHEDYATWLTQLDAAIRSGNTTDLQQVSRQIMSNHASTRERLPILDQFYSTILADCAPVHSILDIACGLNPLALHWMPLAEGVEYYACDIYQDMMDFLAQYLFQLNIRVHAHVCDVIQFCPTQEVDVAFVLKAIPCLEQIDKLAGKRLLRSLNTRQIVVSFPVHSLGGKSKGMASYYEAHFRTLIDEERWQVKKFEFPTELVFLVTK
jgi:16S rRNA (guanine(1405)-N(7))-methyltransferase